MSSSGGGGEPERPGGPSLADGARLLGELDAKLSALTRATAEIVDLVDEVQRSGTVEALEGLTLDALLAVSQHLTDAERWTLLTAARVLRDLPVTRALFADGRLSWSQIRGIVAAVRHLPVADRAGIDTRVAASRDLIDALHPDDLVDAVARAADELRDARRIERREARTAEQNFLAVQPGLDGSVKVYAEYDPVTAAGVLNAIDAAADDPVADTPDAGEPTTRAKQRAAGLARVCAAYLGGGSGREATPLVVVHVDSSEATRTAAGLVELAMPGCLPSLTARAVDAMAADADVRVVLFDGARPLVVTRKRTAAQVADDIRLAIAARDRGCRFPGSRIPVVFADDHHLHAQTGGGDHDPDNQLCLGRRGHRAVHSHGWHVTLDPHTAKATFTRNGRTWTTLPRGTPLRRVDA
jgi:hypothetical protein